MLGETVGRAERRGVARGGVGRSPSLRCCMTDTWGWALLTLALSQRASCTCRMGEGPMPTVDAGGRAHEVEGFRVIDASVKPSIVSGNLNTLTIMMAEKRADLVRGQAAWSRLEVPISIHPQWKTKQR